MKTKFILCGGFDKDRDETNDDFYTEILKGAPQPAKILLVPFAKEPERIGPTTDRVMNEFNRIKNDTDISFAIAREESFLEQVAWADIIFLQGGRTLQLREALKKFQHLADALRGKIIAGESAGANVLGKFFYSQAADTVDAGLSILPLKIISHYTNQYEGKLDSVGEELELVLLPEYTYKIFEMDI